MGIDSTVDLTVLAFGSAPQRRPLVVRRNGIQLCRHYGRRTKERKDVIGLLRCWPAVGSSNDCQQAALGSMASSITPRCRCQFPLCPPSTFPFFLLLFRPAPSVVFSTPQSKRKKKKKRAVSLMLFGSGLTHVLSLLFFCTRFRRFNQRPLAAVHRVVVHDRLHRSAAARRSVQRRRGRRQRRHQPGPPNDSRRRHRMEHGEPLVR